MAIVHSKKYDSMAAYKMALASAAHFIQKEYTFFFLKKKDINSRHDACSR
jgi:hypothetical protein